ncbi:MULTISPECIES: ammonium transporter [Paenibacillus]|uniref:ammonium transporter n=1 Tax=Paenibacillus TaxID=44249 RepID=UPI000BA5DA2A|nr:MULTISPECIES: ammonium transporter [Paenibacillus]MBE7679457.1 ammonium transporter [Paenibacillus sp. P13VS]MBY0218465.1 ammonium transporter [Paenibacillus illinoisensis]PAF32143.1 ammonium transporter [Paenibacillus sp. 7516]WJH30215.1 ammonium transporter [Paenibacillus sp. CC-CFT742]
MRKKWLVAVLLMLTLLAFPVSAFASAEGPTNIELQTGLNSAFTFLAVVLVFLMQGGFALLEAGSTRMKNAGHIAGKTILTLGISVIAFWALGFGLGFGNGNSFFGTTGFFLSGDQMAASFESLAFSDVPLTIKFVFHLAFAAVSLAIACGGMAERAKMSVYIVFGTLYTIIMYPVVAHWVWGGGWLAELGMQDFAGSTVVHLTGATAALVATILLKPRIGKYNKDGKPNIIPGHNQVYSVLGVIILWIGWFGFNPGSTLSAMGDGFFGYVALTTNVAAAAGGVAALLISWAVLGKSDIPSMLNGVLAALVAITGACAFVEPWAALVIGALAGIITFFTAQFFDRKGIDDPIYAFSVHGIAGMWGAISTGLFATPELAESVGVGQAGLFYGGGFHQLGVQLLGLVGAFAFVLVVSFIILGGMKAIMGIRVTEEEETMGLDLSEHGTYGYPEQMKSIEGKTSGGGTFSS